MKDLLSKELSKNKLMNKSTFVILVFLISIAINAQTRIGKNVFAEIEFENEVLTFQKVNEGEDVECDFIFKNVGIVDLIITEIKGSCGCTVPSNWSKEPIKPGESSLFHVKFNTRNIFGGVEKSITVFCNIKNKFKRVKIKGLVEENFERKKMREEIKLNKIK